MPNPMTPTVEQPLVESTEAVKPTEQAQPDPLDVHAQMFFMYGPRLHNTLKLMNKKALVRFLFQLIQHPLNDKELKFKDKLEQDCFNIADNMLTSKYMMVFTTGLQEIERVEKEKAQKEKELLDKTTEVVVESSNG